MRVFSQDPNRKSFMAPSEADYGILENGYTVDVGYNRDDEILQSLKRSSNSRKEDFGQKIAQWQSASNVIHV